MIGKAFPQAVGDAPRYRGAPFEGAFCDPNLHDSWRRVYHEDKAQRKFDDVIYGWLLRALKPHGAWLDAGCGSAEHTIRLAKATGSDVLAIDISPVALTEARKRIESCSLQDRIRLQACAIENLSDSLQVNNVHSRGVLMHIPDWRAALVKLCRCIQEGGYLVVFENDHHSLELVIVRALRRMLHCRSQILRSHGGIEFWSTMNGETFVSRIANADVLAEEITKQGIEIVLRQTTGLFDLYRIPAILRPAAIVLNRLWFRCNLPFGSGVILVGRRSVSPVG